MPILKPSCSKNYIFQFQFNYVLANENFPRPSTIILRKNGYNVKSIQEDAHGIGDPEVLQMAVDLNLIILTFDSDYGELIFRYVKENPPAVVYFREKGGNPEFAATSLISLLAKGNIILSDAFTVIEVNNVRQRFYKN